MNKTIFKPRSQNPGMEKIFPSGINLPESLPPWCGCSCPSGMMVNTGWSAYDIHACGCNCNPDTINRNCDAAWAA